jgi:hypothetical protein
MMEIDKTDREIAEWAGLKTREFWSDSIGVDREWVMSDENIKKLLLSPPGTVAMMEAAFKKEWLTDLMREVVYLMMVKGMSLSTAVYEAVKKYIGGE